MITLNLIPESIRQEIKLKHIYQLNLRLGLLFVYTAVISAVMIYSADVILSSNYDLLTQQSEAITKNTAQYNNRVKALNEQMKVMNMVLQEEHGWDRMLVDVVNILPRGVALSYVRIDQAAETINLSGVAATRDDLLQLKDVLANSGFIKNVELPFTSIFERTNIRFDIVTKIDFAEHEKMSNHK